MWRNILRILPKNVNHICCKSKVHKITNRKRILYHSAFLMSTANVMLDYLPDDTPEEICNETLVTNIDDLQLTADIEATYAQSGEALGNLIKTLHTCIQEICEQYQHCIAKQIEITMACMQMDTLSPQWDEITKYRVSADDLRVEFIKYKTLAATIGSIVNNERFKSETPLSKGEITHVAEAYKGLIDMIEKQTKENSSWDSKLVDVHMKSILVTDVE